MTRFRSLFGVPIRIVTVTALVWALTGCGSGGVTLLQGNQAIRAASVGGYQSLGSGQSYPFAGIQITKPSGSSIPGRAVKIFRAAPPVTFSSLLNLYVAAPVVTGSSYVVNYYTDAAATISAGSMTMTYPSAPPTNNAYATYPVQIQIAQNITSGNLVSQGNFVLTYTGSSGANTLTGTLTIPARGITLTLNLTLSSALQVGGSMTVSENGATVNVGNITGNVLGTITGGVTVAPYGWTGTMSISLLTGAYSVTITNGAGNSTATLNSTGNLDIGYADGTNETVQQPISAPLAGGNGGGGGGGGSTYNAPVAFIGGTPSAINATGQMAGSTSGFNAAYWSSPSASLQTLQLPGGSTSSRASGINASGQIVGNANISGGSLGLFWANSASTPVQLQPLPGDTYVFPSAVNASGQIVGTSQSSSGTKRAAYWSSSTAAPQLLAPASGQTQAEALGINNSGLILGSSPPSNIGHITGVVWTSPTSSPQLLSPLSGDTIAQPAGMNNNGQIVGVSFGAANRGVYWSSPTVQPQLLTPLSGDATTSPFAINDSGIITGESVTSGFIYRAATWTSSLQPTDLNTQIPSGTGWKLEGSFHINNAGVILGKGKKPDNTDGDYAIVPH